MLEGKKTKMYVLTEVRTPADETCRFISDFLIVISNLLSGDIHDVFICSPTDGSIGFSTLFSLTNIATVNLMCIYWCPYATKCTS